MAYSDTIDVPHPTTRRCNGFSLTEIVIVVPLVVLVAVLILRFQGVLARSEARAAHSQDAADTMARLMASLKRDLRSARAWEATSDSIRIAQDRLDTAGQPAATAVAWVRVGGGWLRVADDGAQQPFVVPGDLVQLDLAVDRISESSARCRAVLSGEGGKRLVELDETVAVEGAGK